MHSFNEIPLFCPVKGTVNKRRINSGSTFRFEYNIRELFDIQCQIFESFLKLPSLQFIICCDCWMNTVAISVQICVNKLDVYQVWRSALGESCFWDDCGNVSEARFQFHSGETDVCAQYATKRHHSYYLHRPLTINQSSASTATITSQWYHSHTHSVLCPS